MLHTGKLFLNNIQFVNGRATFLCCSATGPSSGPQLHAAERELDQQVLRRHAELGAASLCRREDGLVDASVPSPVSGQQHRQVDGGGCFKFVSAFHDQHAVVSDHWITAAPLVTVKSCFHPHSWSPCSRPTARCTDFKQTSCTKFGFDAKCSAGKSLENSATLCSSTFLPKVNTCCRKLLSHSLTPGCSRVTSATGGRHFIITGRRLLLTPRTVSCLNHFVGEKNPLV